jgi:hypothetical protein
MYYRQLMAAYPQAKVVLTVRDPEGWYDSARQTILRGLPPGVMTGTRRPRVAAPAASAAPHGPAPTTTSS